MKFKFKSIVTMLLIFSIMLVSLLPAFAEKSLSVKMNVSVSKESNLVTASFAVPKDSDIGTISAEIKFDSNKLTYLNTKYLNGKNILSKTNDKTKDNGSITVNFVSAEALKEECTVFTVYFNINEDAVGKTEFQIESLNITDSNNEPFSVTVDGDKNVVLSGSTNNNQPTQDKTNNDKEDTSNADNENANLPTTSVKIITYTSIAICIIALSSLVAVLIVKKRKTNA